MTRLLAVLLVALAPLVALAQAIPASPEALVFEPIAFEPPRPKQHRVVLAGGIVAFIKEDRTLPLVNIGVQVRTGRWLEPEGKQGLASLVRHDCALAGGLAFAFVGGIRAALSLGARRGGLLTAVIVLPLFTPPVIFGGGALDAFAAGLPWNGGFALLCAYAATAVALGPVAMAAACRNALS